MTQNQISIQYLINKIRHKYADKPSTIKQLEKILWYSYPIVYPNYEIEQRVIEREIENRKKKKGRTRKFIRDMMQCYDELHFATLTFNDETLSNTSERTRHRYAVAFLSECCRCYIGNVDYGENNHREHFHAVVALKEDALPCWKYGYSNFKRIRGLKKNDGDAIALSKYLNKLTNHSGKVGTGKSFRSKSFDQVDELPF